MNAPRDVPTLREIRLRAYDPPAFDPEKDAYLLWDEEARVFVSHVPGAGCLPVSRTIEQGQREIDAAVFCRL